MDWSKHSGGRRGYHHGNLREALIEAALRLIGEKGPGGFTVAEAARAAGVSPAAPYRHFRDGQDLLADVAVRGFERFTAALRRAWDDGRPDPSTAYPALSRAGDDAFAVLREAAEMLCAGLPKGKRPPPLMVALHVWSLSHGIASLFGRGDAARRALPMPPEELLEAAVLIYLRGLGISG